jgi:uncharacterized protein YutE (UPF0331/DUF86 family)
MTKGKANHKVLVDRLDWVDRMIDDIQSIPLTSLDEFMSDRRNLGAAESSLRRALEALLDIGRHLLAKIYGEAVTEYKAIAEALEQRNILSKQTAQKLRILAGYRNRMVHFYHEITTEELYDICSNQIDDLLIVREAFRDWIKQNTQHIDSTL